jgi:sirohydrochlorin ferrochelatase
MLSPGSCDHRVNEFVHRLRVVLQSLRPEVEVNAAFIGGCLPNGVQVVSRLLARGVAEVVFVPLPLTSAVEHGPAVNAAIDRVRAAHPGLKLAVARPIGHEAPLLKALDARLRHALISSRASELDALVLSAAGPADAQGGALLARRARLWGSHHRLPCAAALSPEPGAGIAQAIAELRRQGRRHIAVGSLYLGGGPFYIAQARQAWRHGAVAVSAPIGADPAVLDMVWARYSFAAMELLDIDSMITADPVDLAQVGS